MSKKADTPLIAMLQSEPDPAWQPLLENLEDAKRSYDPEMQTGDGRLDAGTTGTYRTSGSGGANVFPDGTDSEKGVTQGPAESAHPYRALASGGAGPLTDDGSKETLPDRSAGKASYRTASSGGAGPLTDDGSKEPRVHS